MSAHSHGLNGHTHSFTPSGTVSVTKQPIFKGDSITGSVSTTRLGAWTNWDSYAPFTEGCFKSSTAASAGAAVSEANSKVKPLKIVFNATPTGSISEGSYSFSGTKGTTGGNSENTTSTTSTGSFTGSLGYTSDTGGTTGSTGNIQTKSFSIMPPYVVKYCWERTA